MQLTFEKLRDVKTPSRSYSSAGWDFYVPESFPLLDGTKSSPMWQSKVMAPGTQLCIPSGLRVKIPAGHFLKFDNKSGNATRGLLCGATIVDPDYQGEIHLQVWNVSNQELVIKCGDKLLQAYLLPITPVQFYEIQPGEQLFNEASDRGRAGFGSTGRIH